VDPFDGVWIESRLRAWAAENNPPRRCEGWAGILRATLIVSFTLCGYDIPRMDSDYDPRRQAEAAMKLAALADGFERQRWIQIAQAWLELARTSLEPNRSRSGQR